VVLPWSTWAMMAMLRSFMGEVFQNKMARHAASVAAPLARTGRKI
jgi:hypothetical protein